MNVTPEWQSEAAFRSHVLERLVAALDARQQRNLDPDYPADGAVLDAGSYVRKRAAFLDFLHANFACLFEAMRMFEDTDSRRLFVDLLLFRALGHERVRLPSNLDAYWAARAAVSALPASPSRFATLPGGANLKRFSLPQEGPVVDCLAANVFFTFYLRQYYFALGTVRVQPEQGDVAVDAGACFGDTAVAFARSVGASGRVLAFEPVEAHLAVLNANLAQNGLGNVSVYPAALGEADRPGEPVKTGIDPGFADVGGGRARSLDALVDDGSVGRVDFVKMDVEGHELAVLRGATQTLHRFAPKLAISVYHRWEDHFEIPSFIRRLGLGYRMFLANYTISDAETVLYCVRAQA